MICDRCRTTLDQSALYCFKCGKAIATTPLMPRQGRISGHIRLLGILWIALSSFRVIPGVVLFLISRWMPLDDPDIPFFVPALLLFLSVVFLASGVLGVFAGWGLLTRQSWARAFALVFGGLNLMDLPFGTALGIYTLWVLLPTESEREYHRTADAAQPV